MASNFLDYDKDVTLVQRICSAMRKMIRENFYEVGSKLPNEIELAKTFKVSRGTMRAALQILEQSGIIVKRRGIGTFVAKEPMLINNLSMNFGITQVIESIGAKAGTDYMKVYTAPLTDPKIGERLELPADATLLIIERVRTADGKKVAFTQDIFGLDTFYRLTEADSLSELEEYLAKSESLYTYLRARLDKPIHHAISYILPIKCDEPRITELLGISENSVLLEIAQVDYMTDGEPVWMAREYHLPDVFTFSVYRMM